MANYTEFHAYADFKISGPNNTVTPCSTQTLKTKETESDCNHKTKTITITNNFSDELNKTKKPTTCQSVFLSGPWRTVDVCLWSTNRWGGLAAGPTPRSTEGGDHARSLRPSPHRFASLRSAPLRSGLEISQMLLRELGAWLSLVPAHRSAVLPLVSVWGGYLFFLLLLCVCGGETVSYTFLHPARICVIFFLF